MADNRHELWTTLDKMVKTIDSLRAQLTEVRMQVSALNLPDKIEYRCPECDIKFKRRSQMETHLYHRHDGPLPESYARAEQMAGFTVDSGDGVQPDAS